LNYSIYSRVASLEATEVTTSYKLFKWKSSQPKKPGGLKQPFKSTHNFINFPNALRESSGEDKLHRYLPAIRWWVAVGGCDDRSVIPLLTVFLLAQLQRQFPKIWTCKHRF
jgi:hypothetical protein